MNLEEKFKVNLARLGVAEGATVLVALSGGVDSMVLLNLCRKVGINPMAAHANFELRLQESDADEAFVIEHCQKWSIPIFTKTLSLSGQSGNIQSQARRLRYHWFSELLEENKIQLIFTAHHLDDRLETFFINFLRGTGLKGLKAIPEINRQIFRPLLPFRKKELIAYAKAEGIEWRQDTSNEKDVYLRNQIRQQVIPAMEKLDENAVELAGRSLEFLAEADTYFKNEAKEFIDRMECDTFFCKIYESDWDSLFAHPPLHKYVFEALDFESGQLPQLEALKRSDPGKRVVGKSYVAYRDRQRYILKKLGLPLSPDATGIDLEKGSIDNPIGMVWQVTSKPDKFENGTSEAWLAAEKLVFPLELRSWSHGDRFVPLGMKGSKKLSDFLIDQKIPVPKKDRTFVLLSQGEICWVVGHRIDDRFKADFNTRQVVHFQLI